MNTIGEGTNGGGGAKVLTDGRRQSRNVALKDQKKWWPVKKLGTGLKRGWGTGRGVKGFAVKMDFGEHRKCADENEKKGGNGKRGN